MERKWLFAIVVFSVVAYDAMASLISRFLLLEYAYFTTGFLLVWFLAGFLVCWRSGFLTGLLAGFVAELTESTIGWVVAESIGPLSSSLIPPENLSFALISVVVTSCLLSGVVGSIGAAAASLIRKLTAN